MLPMNAKLRRTQEFAKPVEIGSDVWVGGDATILPGVRIGSEAVIGACSVVTRDALAVEHGLTVCSTDSDFGKFPQIRWEDPLVAR